MLGKIKREKEGEFEKLYFEQCDLAIAANRMRLRRLATKVKKAQQALFRGTVSPDIIQAYLDEIERQVRET